MPIYEYQCKSCQDKFELRRSYGDADAPAYCPQCGRGESRRLVSTFASFSKDGGGEARSVGGGGCGSCSGHSCATCGH